MGCRKSGALLNTWTGTTARNNPELLMNTLIAALLLSSFSSLAMAQDKPCAPAKHAKLPKMTEKTYHSARKALLAAGWQPVRTKSYNEEDPDTSSGNGKLFWEQGYRELLFCSGTGMAPCGFLFSDVYGNRLQVETSGEEMPKEKYHAVVVGFRFVCS